MRQQAYRKKYWKCNSAAEAVKTIASQPTSTNQHIRFRPEYEAVINGKDSAQVEMLDLEAVFSNWYSFLWVTLRCNATSSTLCTNKTTVYLNSFPKCHPQIGRRSKLFWLYPRNTWIHQNTEFKMITRSLLISQNFRQ